MSEFILVTTYFKAENIFLTNKKLFTNSSHSGHKLYRSKYINFTKEKENIKATASIAIGLVPLWINRGFDQVFVIFTHRLHNICPDDLFIYLKNKFALSLTGQPAEPGHFA